MDFFDFLSPEWAQIRRLDRIADAASYANSVARRKNSLLAQSQQSLTDIREDVNFLTMVLIAILRRLSEKQTLSMADLSDLLTQIDGLDGRADQGVSPDILRGILGVIRGSDPGSNSQTDENSLPVIDTDSGERPISFRRFRGR